MDRVSVLKGVIITAALCFYFSTGFLFLKRRKIGYSFAAAGSVLNIAIVGYNYYINGYVPFVSMYQVLTFLAVSFVFTYLYMHFVLKVVWVAPYFTACSAIVLTGVSFMKINIVWHFPPALQSFWFIPHVFSYMLAYSLCTVSFLILITSTVTNKLKLKQHLNRKNAEQGIHAILRIAFPFMTTGLLLGAIWANNIWGAFWSFDPKENWSFVTWCFYTLYLHCRRRSGLKKYANWFIVLGFIALLITFFGVNLIKSSALHSYT